MKIKYIIIAIVTLLFTGCSSTNVSSSNVNSLAYLDSVYQIGIPEYTEKYTLNNRNVISDAPTQTVQPNMESKPIELFNDSRTTTYVKSLYYPVGDCELHKYTVDGLNGCYVLFREDGSVDSILGDFAQINISGEETAEELKPMVENVICKWLNPENYQYVKYNQNRYNENTFGLYDFIYYNEYDGYITSFATVSIQDNGTISSLKIIDCEIGDGFYINKEVEKQVLDAKMHDMCTTTSTQLENYMIEGTPTILRYNGELCIQYDISCSIIIKLDSNKSTYKVSYRQYILIPIVLLQNNTNKT